jgi:hypothetical protein
MNNKRTMFYFGAYNIYGFFYVLSLMISNKINNFPNPIRTFFGIIYSYKLLTCIYNYEKKHKYMLMHKDAGVNDLDLTKSYIGNSGEDFDIEFRF